MTYFSGLKSKELIKKKYRKLSLELHPDLDGTDDEFIELRRQYDAALKGLVKEVHQQKQQDTRYRSVDDEYISIIDELVTQQEIRGYKKMWVYFRFIDIMKNDLELKHLEYLAEKLGYQKAWAKFKYEELF